MFLTEFKVNLPKSWPVTPPIVINDRAGDSDSYPTGATCAQTWKLLKQVILGEHSTGSEP